MTLDYLKRLIAFDTTSRNSNLELIEWVQALLEARGVRVDLSFSADKQKANLFATLGASRAPGIVLSGHTDVVPVEQQDWHTEPFQAVTRAGRLYGRGACDMKGFIAVCLAQVDTILNADLDVPVHFAFSYDEEVGCVGVRELLADLKRRSIHPTACIVGEPTNMDIVHAHKGMLFQRCCVRGKAAHSSLPHQGVNAVAMAAKVISYVHDLAARVKQQGPFDAEFEPPYTTLHCGVVHGGSVNNIIPAECNFDFEIRNLPGHDALPLFEQVKQYAAQELQPSMQAIDPQCGFVWQALSGYPGMQTPRDAPWLARVAALLKSPPGRPPGKVSYGTEGGLFQQAGITTVICGPGSIVQAHKPDEYVELAQLQQAEEFIAALIAALK